MAEQQEPTKDIDIVEAAALVAEEAEEQATVRQIIQVADRRGKLTDRRLQRLLKAIRLGMPKVRAAKYAGICEKTLYRWLEKYPVLAEVLEEAEAGMEHDYLKIIQKAAGDQWQAGAWLLERRLPGTYGRRGVVQHTGSIGGGAPQIKVLIAYTDGPLGSGTAVFAEAAEAEEQKLLAAGNSGE